MRVALLAVLVLLLLTGCDGSPEPLDFPGDVTTGELQTTDSGLQYVILREGYGETPQEGQTVSVHYSGYLVDAEEPFDSSVERGEPFQFQLGASQVIKGWDEGVALMKIGEKRKLIIPPDLGYGEEGFPGAIPENATLVFDVELLSAE